MAGEFNAAEYLDKEIRVFDSKTRTLNWAVRILVIVGAVWSGIVTCCAYFKWEPWTVLLSIALTVLQSVVGNFAFNLYAEKAMHYHTELISKRIRYNAHLTPYAGPDRDNVLANDLAEMKLAFGHEWARISMEKSTGSTKIRRRK